jgi:hypothetical protein
MLEHRNAECTGEWRLVQSGENRQIVCAGCGAEFRATPARRRAAVDEILAGSYLQRLADEGTVGDAELDLGEPNLEEPDLDEVA